MKYKDNPVAYRRKYYLTHREHILAVNRQYALDHPEQRKKDYVKYSKTPRGRDVILSMRRKNSLKRRLMVLTHYSPPLPKCECCGERQIEFLQIDHIGGGGAGHRKITGMGGRFIAWIIKNNFPEGLRVLCANCNMAISRGKSCPHQDKSKVKY